jgi:hypothetical protein
MMTNLSLVTGSQLFIALVPVTLLFLILEHFCHSFTLKSTSLRCSDFYYLARSFAGFATLGITKSYILVGFASQKPVKPY